MSSPPDNPPLFLVGAERSGSTLLRLMLAGHPLIAWRGEFDYAVDPMTDDGGVPALADFHDWLEGQRIFRLHGCTVDPRLGYRDLVDDFLRQARHAGEPVVGASLHRGFDRLPRLWPDARYVHLVRDPRDVAPSCVAMGWHGNVWTGAEPWVEAERVWDRLRAALDPTRWIEVRFETLARQPVAELTRICDLAGIAYDETMLDYPSRSGYGPPSAEACERWRRTLGENDVRLVEARTGDLLVERGYARSGLPPLEVTPARARRLLRQDRRARRLFRVRRYGASLVAARYLAGRLGMRAWERALDRRIQLKVNAELK